MKLLPLPAVFLFTLLLSLFSPAGFAEEMPEWIKPGKVEPKRRMLPESVRHGVAPTAVVQLDAPDLAALRAEDAQARILGGFSKGPTRVGVRRALTHAVRLQGDKAPWTAVPKAGRVWTARIASAGAHGMRLRFEEVRLPAGVEVVVYDTAHPEQVEGPFDADYLAGRSAFWSSTVFAEDVTVECRVPEGADLPAFQVTEVTHRYVALGTEGKSAEAKAAGSCNIDLACEPAWLETSRAVAGIGSVSASGELFCTGCLLNDSNPASGTDYFLTADHCIAGQSDADTAEFYWNYQAASCGATPPNPATVPRTIGGAAILSARSRENLNDHCFLRLRGTVPAGVAFAGWTSTSPESGEVVTGIHHPDGDYKRISFGTATAADANYWRVQWTRGVTEPGSSGSPVFNAQHQVIGQLFGGLSSCDNTNPSLQNDDYGRFDVTFPFVRKWLMNEPVAPPANDNFASAQVLVGDTGSTAAIQTVDATRETGEPDHAGGGGRNSVWFRWTAPSSGVFTFATVANNFNTALAVYTGNSLGTLVRVASNDDVEEGVSSSRVGIQATAGTAYQIAVDGAGGEFGSFQLGWQPGGEVTAPPNDRFADAATVVGFGGIYHSVNRGFTRESGEPNHAGAPGNRSAWWTWTAPVNGTVTVNTFGSGFDTILAVYTGSAVNALSVIASNDDYDFNNEVYESGLSFNAVAGRVYRIAVDGYNGTSGQQEGEIRLEVSQSAGNPGANNAFAAAIAITGATGSSTGNNLTFTREAGEPLHAGIDGRRSAWWSWTAPSSGNFVFETIGSSFDTVLAVYTGSSVTSLTAVASNDDILLGDLWQSRVTFPAVQGQVYRIAVDGYYEAGGTQEQGNIRLAWRPSSTGSLALGDLTPVLGDTAPRVENRSFLASDCEVASGCGVVGDRRLLLVDFQVRNVGSASVVLPTVSSASGFVTNACRNQLEWPAFVTLRLLTPGGTVVDSREVSMCVSDGARWSATNGPASAQFNCGNQGVSAGWAAVSGTGTACRWLDVTAQTPGDYLLEIVADPGSRFTESNETNNVLRVAVTIPAAVTVPNDAFASATSLVGFAGTSAGSTVGATLEATEPASNGRSTVWFLWSAPCTGTAVFDTFGSDFDTVLDAFSGNALGTLAALAVSDDFSETNLQSEVRFPAVQGTSYRLRVSGYEGTVSGNAVLNWRMESTTGCGSAIAVAGASMGAGGFEVRFASTSGGRYVLQSASDLSRTPLVWADVASATASGTETRITDGGAVGAGAGVRFYRVVRLP